MAGFSIVLVTWQSAGHLAALVRSMTRHLSTEPELVVMDNASSDDPEGVARSWHGPMSFTRLERNAGYGTAANAGVEAASSDAVVLLNPDTELIDGGLGELAALAVERGALVGPRVLNPDRSIQPSASGSPVGAWPWIGAVIPGRVQPGPLRARTEPWRLDRTVRVAWLTGACVAAPRDALLELGPFDPGIDMYSEDMDLGLRAAAAGIPSLFCPQVCRIVHQGGASAALRFPDGPQQAAALNRRAVLRRAYGASRERRSWLARRTNLRLRVLAKRALGRNFAPERAELTAALSAQPVRDLGPPPAQPS
jgi:N-acetylglucosaminyl-diphospho-decaprenol L-rhamnosyltransferase